MQLIERVVGWLVIAIFVFFVLATSWQVVMRYLFADSLAWVDEACRYGFIWMVFLAATLCARHGTHMAITLLEEMLGAGSRKSLLVVADIALIVFAVVVGWGGWQLMQLNWTTLSPATGIPIAWVEAILPIFGGLTTLFALEHLVRVLTDRLGEPGPAGGGD